MYKKRQTLESATKSHYIKKTINGVKRAVWLEDKRDETGTCRYPAMLEGNNEHLNSQQPGKRTPEKSRVSKYRQENR